MIVRALAGLPATLARLDLASTCAQLEAALRRRGARAQPTAVDLLLRHGRTPGAAIATFVLESERLARAVVSHVHVPPFYAGVALAVHPRPELDAPLLVADLGIPPPGVTRIFVDACGPAVDAPGFEARFRSVLAPILDSARDLDHEPVPAWLAPRSGGCGGRLRARRGEGGAALGVLSRYLDRYLEALDHAPVARDAAANRDAARAVAATVRANGPAGRYLTRTFGASFAGRYADLLWNEA